MKKALVTGVAGFIGSKVAQGLLEKGWVVVGVDDLSVGKIEVVPDGVEFIEHDLANSNGFINFPKRVDIILHLAGQSSGEKSFDDPVKDLHKNTASTLNIIEYGLTACADRILYASSMSVYGNSDRECFSEKDLPVPLSCYGVSKAASEMYLHVYENKLPFVAFRMFNVYGPGQLKGELKQGMIRIFLTQILNSGHVEVRGSLERKRDYVYIDDVVNTWLRVVENKKIRNTVLNVGTGVGTSLNDLFDLIHAEIPNFTTSTTVGTPGDQFCAVADIKKVQTVLGEYDPIGLSDGLSRYIRWITE